MNEHEDVTTDIQPEMSPEATVAESLAPESVYDASNPEDFDFVADLQREMLPYVKGGYDTLEAKMREWVASKPESMRMAAQQTVEWADRDPISFESSCYARAAEDGRDQEVEAAQKRTAEILDNVTKDSSEEEVIVALLDMESVKPGYVASLAEALRVAGVEQMAGQISALSLKVGDQDSIATGIALAQKVGLQIGIVHKTLERIHDQVDETTKERITAVKSFQALFAELDQLGGLKGSNGIRIPAHQLYALIIGVKNEGLPLDTITRSAGLRAKVAELVEQSKSKREEIRRPNGPIRAFANNGQAVQGRVIGANSDGTYAVDTTQGRLDVAA